MISPLIRRLAMIVVVLGCAASFAAAELPVGRPGDLGLDAATLSEIPVKMNELVAKQRVAGAVTLVLRKGKIVEFDAVGMADIENKRPMQKDSIFWIASMTKPIAATSVMILVDEKKLSLDDPASKYLPSFKKAKLRDGSSPGREITIRDLLSHTSGLSAPPRLPSDMSSPLRLYADSLIQQPLDFEPGTKYKYGFGLTAAGAIVEVVSGQPYEKFLEERIFRPLGMNDTSFSPNKEQRARVATTYRQSDDKHGLTASICPFFTADVTIKPAAEPSGGLFSTARDYATFLQMIANGGELEGVRVVSAASIAEMTKPHLIYGKPNSYGLGWAQVGPSKNAGPHGLSGIGHGGAFATNGLIDPQQGIIAVLMIQRQLTDDGGDVQTAFHKQLVKSIRD